MQIPTKKLKNGFEMPILGIGTSRMTKGSEDIKAIKKAIEMGYSHIDTAEIYADGEAERKVGVAIKGFERNKLFLTSKVAAHNLHYEDVISSCKASLDRLGTDFLDLYLIHWPNPDVPIKETMQALDFLMKEGLIKNIGVSNFSAKQVKEAENFTQNLIVVNQIHYNLISQEPDNIGALKYAKENDMLVTAYSPLEVGVLTDEKGELGILAKKYAKTPAQVAINWLISQKNVVTIVKASSIDHLRENLGSLGWEMDESDVRKLLSGTLF